MTKDEALKLALDALMPYRSTVTREYTVVDQAISACRAALAQPKQEPIGTLDVWIDSISGSPQCSPVIGFDSLVKLGEGTYSLYAGSAPT